MKAPMNHSRLVGLTLLACLFFMPPLLLIFDRPSSSGLSWLPVYIFIVWLIIIGLAAWILEGSRDE
ncbi:hypothetical protein SAMN05660443_0546 [Marinospirillum celere]|uniref:Uncharacterized protein n=1 Tax=Marinospirillum celere TaxID=1122252 RepID=A0A1I1EE76_9GAMM|nr:hypothetical protein [Marinospirillum celere]SFB85367.1 hypothetical protein SAMN05660443_0546 [Marinospirillum celere]